MFLLRYSRHFLMVMVYGLCLSLHAAESTLSLSVSNVSRVEDITASLLSQGLYNLQVRFAEHVAPAERTHLLTAAFEHENASRIEQLDLDHNQLIESPVLTRLVGLKRLLMRCNKLAQPPVLSGLVSLEMLLLCHNQLNEAPVLDGIVNLKYLDLACNTLNHPPVLNGLSGLECLDLSCNRLVEPPVLTDMRHLSHLDLMNNPLEKKVIIPLVLLGVLNTAYIRAPYRIDTQALVGEETRLVDIATPDVDTVPFFFTKGTIGRLTAPICNPLTSRRVVQAMSLAASWRYWRDRGMAAAVFDAKLREIEPVLHEENVYTIDRDIARAFMVERQIPNARITKILSRLRSSKVNVTALLDCMNQQQINEVHVDQYDDEMLPAIGVFTPPCVIS